MFLRYLMPLCALAGLLTAGWATAQQPDRPAFPGGGRRGSPAALRTAWEYRVLGHAELMRLASEKPAKDQLTGGLNKLGAEGWELVTVARGDEFVLKRPAGRTLRSEPAASAERPPAPAAAAAPAIKMYRLRNAKAADMERTLSKMFQSGGRTGLRFASDERTNSVLAYGTPTQLDEIEAVLNRLDTPDREKTPARK